MNMNKHNRRPELIVSLAGVVGHARRVLSENIQRNLFRVGYTWVDGGPTPQNLDAEILHVSTPDWNPTHLTFENVGPACTENPAMFFDGVTQSATFLAAAKNALIEKRVIDGVAVTITPNGVTLDLTDLTTKVTTKATEVQRELFGQ
jgi:hypothetical protein